MKYPRIDKHTGTSTPRPTQGTRAGYIAMERAQAMACLVRDESADGIGAYLDRLDRNALYGLTVALAAMVPIDTTAEALMGWLEPTLEAVA